MPRFELRFKGHEHDSGQVTWFLVPSQAAVFTFLDHNGLRPRVADVDDGADATDGDTLGLELDPQGEIARDILWNGGEDILVPTWRDLRDQLNQVPEDLLDAPAIFILPLAGADVFVVSLAWDPGSGPCLVENTR